MVKAWCLGLVMCLNNSFPPSELYLGTAPTGEKKLRSSISTVINKLSLSTYDHRLPFYPNFWKKNRTANRKFPFFAKPGYNWSVWKGTDFCFLSIPSVQPQEVADLYSKILDALPNPRTLGSKFFQLHAVLEKIWQNRMLPPSRGLAPPPWRNPGSATDKSS